MHGTFIVMKYCPSKENGPWDFVEIMTTRNPMKFISAQTSCDEYGLEQLMIGTVYLQISIMNMTLKSNLKAAVNNK